VPVKSAVVSFNKNGFVIKTMKKFQRETMKIRKAFDSRGKGKWRKWTPEAMLIDLQEEVGELSSAVLVKEGFKTSKRKKGELENALADCLFDLMCLANHYEIDLGREYSKVLVELEERIEKNEF
jgi:NTP pyrophosphatase (non-canonical NTP hydrolase)